MPVSCTMSTDVATRSQHDFDSSESSTEESIGSSNSSQDQCSGSKRYRTAFSKDQLKVLENEFKQRLYITKERRQELSSELNLPESTIKVWFQNRRMRDKRLNSSPFVLPFDYSHLATVSTPAFLAHPTSLPLSNYYCHSAAHCSYEYPQSSTFRSTHCFIKEYDRSETCQHSELSELKTDIKYHPTALPFRPISRLFFPVFYPYIPNNCGANFTKLVSNRKKTELFRPYLDDTSYDAVNS